MIPDLTDTCEHCLNLRRPVKPIEPVFTELVSEGIRADYQCRVCGGCWYVTRDPDGSADVLTGEAAA